MRAFAMVAALSAPASAYCVKSDDGKHQFCTDTQKTTCQYFENYTIIWCWERDAERNTKHQKYPDNYGPEDGKSLDIFDTGSVALAQKKKAEAASTSYAKIAAGVTFGAIAVATVAGLVAQNRKQTVEEYEETLL